MAASTNYSHIVSLRVNKTKRTRTEKNNKTLILGIGNPILRDDRVGHFFIQILRSRISSPGIVLQKTSLAGLDLAEFFVGFKSAVVIDAIQSGGTPGTVYCLKPEDFNVQLNQNDLHGTGLLQALELGKSLGWPMPQDVTIVAIEAGDASSFGDDLTPEVEKAIPVALEKIEKLLSDQMKVI